MAVKSPYETAGFVRANQAVSRRLIVAVDGAEKCGKSHFAMSAPGPLGIINLDIGLDGVVQKFQGQKEIWVTNIDFRVDLLTALNREKAAEAATALLSNLMQKYEFLLG